MALTVVFLSAVICSGALAASSFKGVVKRGATMLLFMGSAFISGLIGLGVCAGVSRGCGLFYHLNATAFVGCYVILGLVMARSRIRLVVHHYEVKPSWMVIGLLIFTPMVVGMATLVSFGWLSSLGFVAMAIVSKYADVSPKAPGYVKAPEPNIPQEANESAVVSIEPAPEAPLMPEKSEKPEGVNLYDRGVVEETDVIGNQLKSPTVKSVKKYPEMKKGEYDGWK